MNCIDAFARQVMAYVLSESLKLDFVLETVQNLIDKHSVSLDADIDPFRSRVSLHRQEIPANR